MDGVRTIGSYSPTGGTFTIASNQILGLNSGGSLDGGGVMNLGYSYIRQNAANVLFTNTNGTIQGHGEIGFNGLSLLNQANGIISASTSGQTLSLNDSGTFTNNGLMRAMNGGTLNLHGSADVINNGTIRSENGSNVSIQNRIIGGTLDNTGSSGALTLDNAARLRDVTVAAGSTVTNNTNNSGIENTLINLGTLSSSGFRIILVPTDTTISGGGTVALANGFFNNSGANRTLTNTDNILRGYGEIGFGSGSGSLNVINDPAGTIQADVSGQNLHVNGSGTFTNNGLMRAMNGGTLVFSGSADVINNATIRSENGSNVSIANRIVGGTLDNTGFTGALTLDNAARLRDVTIAAGSTVTNNTNNSGLENTLINLGSLSSSGFRTILVATDTTLSGGGTVALANGFLNNAGANRTLTNTDNILRGYGEIGFGSGSLSVINSAGGIIQADVSGQNLTLNGSGTFTNNGLFAARNGGTLQQTSGTFTNFSGSTLTGGAYFADNSTLSLNVGPIVTNAATVVLSGPNSIFTAINSIHQNDGIFAITNGRNFSVAPLPPAAPGALSPTGTTNAFTNVETLILGLDSSLTVNGDYAQGSDSALEIVIGADYPSANYHHMNVTGSVNLAGKLEVKLANGYTPAPNQTFEIIHGSAINGGFVEVVGATVTYTSTGVFINATGNTNALALSKAVSRKTHAGPRVLDINLPLSGEPAVESRNSAGNHTLVFSFSNNIVSGNASLSSGIGSVSGSPTFAGKTMMVNLTGVANKQKITVTLNNVMDVFSQVLPPTSVSVGMLQGDTNGDGVVNVTDTNNTKSKSGQVAGPGNAQNDVTLNGRINVTDTNFVKSRSGDFIPPQDTTIE